MTNLPGWRGDVIMLESPMNSGLTAFFLSAIMIKIVSVRSLALKRYKILTKGD